MDADAVRKILRERLVWVVAGIVLVLVLVIGSVLIVIRDRQEEEGGLSGAMVVGAGVEAGENADDSSVGESAGLEDSCESGLWVDVAGAVVEPGVYCIEATDTVEFVLDRAGGLAESACAAWVERDLNRASLVEPNSKIYVPSVDDPECGAISGEVPAGVVSSSGSDSAGTSSSGGGCSGGRININKATSAELQELSGVGPSTAEKIIEGRPYSKIEDLLEVKGIGEATLEKFKDDICL